MNINLITIGELKELAPFIKQTASATQPVEGLDNDMIGQKVIIRTYAAGNFFGVLLKKRGEEVILGSGRRMWYWKAAEGISLSACALHGIDQADSRIVAPLVSVWLKAIEIIPCTAKAIKSLEGAPHAEAR